MHLKLRPTTPLNYFTLFILFTVALLLLTHVAFSQSPQPAKDKNFTPGADISLGLLGQTSFARNQIHTYPTPGETHYTELTQSQSPSPGVLATYHQAWKPYLGYNINFGYTRFTQTNSFGQGFSNGPGAPPGTPSAFGMGSMHMQMYELSAAYAFYGPRSKRFRTTGQLGAGELIFDPLGPPEVKELKCAATMIFGVGGEYDLSRHFAIRAEYRGFFYRTPFFNRPYFFPSERLYTVTNMPAVSLVYRFGSSSGRHHQSR